LYTAAQLAAAEQVGIKKVTDNPNNYSLYTAAQLAAAEQVGIKKVTDNPNNYSLYTAAQLAAAEQVGIKKVTDNPNNYSLYTAAELVAAEQTGIDKVKTNPANYDLFTATDLASEKQIGVTEGEKNVTDNPSNHALHTTAELTARFEEGKTQGRQECMDTPESCGISVALPLQPEYTPTPTRMQPQVIMVGINPSLVHHSDTQITILAVVRPGAVPIEAVTLTLDGDPLNNKFTFMSILQNGDQIWEYVFSFVAGSFGTTDYPIEWGKEPGQFAIHVMDTGGQISAIFPTLKFGNYPDIGGQ
ncbi:MAG: hypothetical protein GY862_29455, partial [Gammaproteobacteria bacterium]|nr:hypothetical protein [Gammaproteobacteria bacterium]